MNNVSTDEKKHVIDRRMQIITAVVITVLAIPLALDPEQGQKTLKGLFNYFSSTFDSMFLMCGFICVIFSIAIAMSKYGNIVLARDKDAEPRFSKFTWTAMIFSAGIATGLILWGVVEWGYHFQSPPLGIEPKSKEALVASLGTGIFHWGPTAWAFYCVPAIAMSYIYYVRKEYVYKISEGCRGVLGKYTDGIAGRIVDYMFIFTILAAAATSLGLGIPMISAAIAELLNIEASLILDVSIVLATSLVFTLSARAGLSKGIARLANSAVIASVFLFIFILVVGPSSFIAKIGMDGIAFFLDNFFTLSFITDPVSTKVLEDGTKTLIQQESSFPQWWTVFYWSWWMVYAPFMGLFVTSLSQGRTIREVVFGMLFWGTVGCTAFYTILGGYGMNLYINDIIDLPKMVNDLGGAQTVIEVLKTLPFPNLILALLVGIGITFLATTFDSAAQTMACATTSKLEEGEEPSSNNKLFWCALIAIVPIVLLIIGGGLKPIQTASVLMGFPTMVILFMMMYTLVKFLEQDERKGIQHLSQN